MTAVPCTQIGQSGLPKVEEAGRKRENFVFLAAQKILVNLVSRPVFGLDTRFTSFSCRTKKIRFSRFLPTSRVRKRSIQANHVETKLCCACAPLEYNDVQQSQECACYHWDCLLLFVCPLDVLYQVPNTDRFGINLFCLKCQQQLTSFAGGYNERGTIT